MVGHVLPHAFREITLHSLDHCVPGESDLVQVKFDIVYGRHLGEVNPGIKGEVLR